MNKILIDGFLGRDAEVRQAKSGISVCNLSVASTYRKGKDDKDGTTTWFSCTAFGKTADGCRTLRKGDHVHIDGRVQEEEYEAKDGSGKKKAWKVIANSVSVDVVARGASGGTAGTVKGEETVAEPDFLDSIPF